MESEDYLVNLFTLQVVFLLSYYENNNSPETFTVKKTYIAWFDFSPAPRQALQGHVRDLQHQVSKRDEMIDRLRAELHSLKEEQKIAVNTVSCLLLLELPLYCVKTEDS